MVVNPTDLHTLLNEIFLLLDDGDRRVLAPFDISVTQFNVLRHLERHETQSINELSALLLCDKSNTTRLINRMEKDNLVSRERDPNDRRYVKLRLTEAGITLRNKTEAAHSNSVSRRFALFSDAEKTLLYQKLCDLQQHLEEELQNPYLQDEVEGAAS